MKKIGILFLALISSFLLLLNSNFNSETIKEVNAEDSLVDSQAVISADEYRVIYNPNGGSLLDGNVSIYSNNLISLETYTTDTTNGFKTSTGVIFIDNGDGTITVSGTNENTTEDIDFYVLGSDYNTTIPAGTYYLSGSAQTGYGRNVSLCQNSGDSMDIEAQGAIVDFSSGDVKTSFKIRIASNVNLGNNSYTFAPSLQKITVFNIGETKALEENSFKRTGYTFAGWNTSPDGKGQSYNAGDRVTNLTSAGSEITLYAQWVADDYTFELHSNYGTNHNQTISLKYDQSFALTNPFDRDYYTFVEWNTKADGTGQSFSNDEVVTNLVNAGINKLYAIWRENVVNVVYNPNGADSVLVWDKNAYAGVGVTSPIVQNDYTDKSVKELNEALAELYAFKLGLNDENSYNPLVFSALNDDNYNHKHGLVNGKNYYELFMSRTGYYWINYWYVGSLDGNIEDIGILEYPLEGTTFNGIYLANKCGVGEEFKNGDVTVYLYAYWKPCEYTITFNGNGSTSGDISNMSMKYDETKTLPVSGYTKTGYSLIGWNTKSDGSGDFYQAGQAICNLTNLDKSNVTLYAQWVKDSYKIEFMNNDGTDDSTTYEVGFNKSFTLSHSVSRDYCTFLGWSTSPDGEVVYKEGDSVNNLTSTPDGVVTLYAVWRQHTVSIVYHTDGATQVLVWDYAKYDPSKTNQSMADDSSYALEFTNKSVEEFNAYLKNLYTWKMNENDMNSYYPLVFNAYSEQFGNHNYQYGLINGINNYEIILKRNYYKWIDEWYIGGVDSDIVIRQEPTTEQRENKSFNGIYLASLAGRLDDLKEGNITIDLYPKWEANTYAITFDANGGSGSMDSMTISYDKTYSLRSNEFTKDGYTFIGWSTTKGGSVAYTNTAVITNLGKNLTLYAVWQANSYKINFNSNNGTNSIISTTVLSNEYHNLRKNTFTRSGYEFVGWNTKVDGSGEFYIDEASIINLANPNMEITLYAIWTPISYNVVYNANGGTNINDENNIIPQPFTDTVNSNYNAFTRNGITYKDNGDGTITFSGVAKDASGNKAMSWMSLWENFTLPAGVYYLSGCHNSISDVIIRADFKTGEIDKIVDTNKLHESGSGTIFIIKEDTQFERIKIRVEGGTDVSTPLTFAPSLVRISDYSYDETVTINSDVSRDYYTFLGWSTDKNATVPMYTNGDVVKNLTTSDGGVVTLYAVWNAHKVNVVYHTNGATSVNIKGIGDFTNKTEEELNQALIEYYKNLSQELNVVSFDPNIASTYGLINGNSTSHLYMEKTGYNPTMSWNIRDKYGNSTGIYLNQDVFYNNALNGQYAGDPLYKECGGFNGKYLAAKAGRTEDYKNGDITIHLYYSWEANNYTITFNSNGGSGSMANVKMIYDKAQTLPANSFTQSGYTFVGWNTQSNGSGEFYTNSSSVINLTSVDNDTVTLYAIWANASSNTVTITFDGNGSTSGSMSNQNVIKNKANHIYANNYVKDYYTFLGWSTDPDASTPSYIDGDSITLSANITLYAVWRQNTVTVLYDGNGATSIKIVGYSDDFASYSFEDFNKVLQDFYQKKLSNGGKWAYNPTVFNAFSEVEGNHNWEYGLATINHDSEVIFTKDGYTAFTSWYLDTESDNYINQDPSGSLKVEKSFNGKYIASKFNKDEELKHGDIVVTFYVHWIVHEYTIVFDAHGGTGTMGFMHATYDNTYSLRKNSFTRSGFTFVGWNTKADGSGITYVDGESVKNLTTESDGEVRLYAQWVETKDNSYTIIYDPNGGSIVGGLTTSSSNLIPYPYESQSGTSSGLKFDINPDGSIVVNGTATADTDLYLWGSGNNLKLPAGTYYLSGAPVEGGTSVILTDNDLGRIDIGYGKMFTLTEETAISFKIRIAKGTTLNNVVFYPSLVKIAKEPVVGVNYTLDPNTFVKEGYTFAGWSVTTTGEVMYADKAVVKDLVGVGETFILYAKWNPITYTIKFNANGGSGSMSNLVMTYNVNKALTTNQFNRPGYTFIGWNTKSDGSGISYADSEGVMNLTNKAETINLYAMWKINSYNIKFNANGGDGTMPAMDCEVGKYYKLLPNTFTCDGYTFKGWATSQGGNVIYKNSQDVKDLISTNGGTVTLYAVWEHFESNVDFLIYYYEQSALYKTLYLAVQMVIDNSSNNLTSNYQYTFTVYNITSSNDSRLIVTSEGATINGNMIVCGNDLELTDFEANYYGLLTIKDGSTIISEIKTNIFSVNSIANEYLNNKTLKDKDRLAIEAIPTLAPVRVIHKFSSGGVISDEVTYFKTVNHSGTNETYSFSVLSMDSKTTYTIYRIYKGVRTTVNSISGTIDPYGVTYEVVYTQNEGIGSEADPFLIRNLEDLKEFQAMMVEANNYGNQKYYKIINDIDAKGENITIFTFLGTLDGDGHTISGLNIVATDGGRNYGFIRCLGNTGKVMNLTISGSVRSNGIRTGGIVGYNSGQIINCTNNAQVIGTSLVGGIAGYCDAGSIIDSINNATVTGTTDVGGIIGHALGNSSVNNCVNNGSVLGTQSVVGGIVGNAEYTHVSNSYNYGDVTGVSKVGGVVGELKAESTGINNCSNYGYIRATGKYDATVSNSTVNFASVGGIVGETARNLTTSITSCNNYGNVEGAYVGVGGIAGKIDGYTITLSNNYGSIKNTNHQTGGIVGYVLDDATITYCVNYGDVNSRQNTGGIVGKIQETNNTTKTRLLNCINEGNVNAGGWGSAGIVGYAYNTEINNCINKGKVHGTSGQIGGIAGALYGNSVATNCSNYGNISANYHLGGIVGYLQGKVTYCTNYGNIESIKSASATETGYTLTGATVEFSSCSLVGGIAGVSVVGDVNNTMSYCVNNGSVSGYNFTGGIIGGMYDLKESKNTLNIRANNCTNNGVIKGKDYTGGIFGGAYVGVDETTTVSIIFNNCTNNGLVIGETGVGGIVGDTKSFKLNSDKTDIIDTNIIIVRVENSKNNGEVCGYEYVGGIVGCLRTNSNSIHKVQSSINNATVSGVLYVGGIVGYSDANITDSFNYGVVLGDKYVGGITGELNNTIINCDNSADVQALNGPCGGIVGNILNNVTINNSDNYGYIRCCNISETGQIYGYLATGKTITGLDTNNTKGDIGHACIFKYVWSSDYLSCSYTTTCANEEYKESVTANLDRVTLSLSSDSTTLSTTYYVVFDNELIENQSISIRNENLTIVDNILTITLPKSATLVPSHEVVKFYANDNNAKYHVVYYSQIDKWDGKTVSTSLQGSGTEKDPYLIQSAADLVYLQNEFNAFSVGSDYLGGKYYKLTKSIDLNNNAVQIGVYNTWDERKTFNGIFDGNNCTIRGITTPLFGAIGSNGSIKNLSVYGTINTSAERSGAIAVYNYGIIDNCYNYVTITSSAKNAGGIVGYNEHEKGQVINCVNYGNITVTGSNTGAGGIAGENKNVVTDCVNFGIITGYAEVGGIVGSGRKDSNYPLCSVISSTNYGSVKGGQHTGGIVGQMQGNISDCVNYGNVTSTSSESGGIFGKLWVANGIHATVNNCINYGDLSLGSHSGTLFGNVENATVSNCINYGNLVSTGSYVGAICAYVFAGATVVDCANYGSVTANTNLCGIAYRINGCAIRCNNYGTLKATQSNAVMEPICIDIGDNAIIVDCNNDITHKNASSYSITQNVHYYECGDSNCTLDHDHENHTDENSCSVCGYNANQLLFKPGVWNVDGAWYAAYFYNDSGNKWVKMTDSNSDGIYEVNIPNGYNNVIFCRMKSSDKTTLSFDNRWNQTEDLSIFVNSGDTYSITGWGSDKSTGSWSVTNNHLDVYLNLNQNNTIYFTPTSEWKQDNARFAVYAWVQAGSELVETWVNMTDSNNDGMYEAELPSYYTNVIFVRLDPNKSENNFIPTKDGGSMWNQTQDFTKEGSMNKFVMQSIDPNDWNFVTDYYWEAKPVNIGDYSFQKTSTTNVVEVTLYLEAGYYEFKVFEGNSWYGNSGTFTNTMTNWEMETQKNNCTLKATGGYYTFSYNLADNKLTVNYLGYNKD